MKSIEKEPDAPIKKEGFTTGFAVFFATLGSAVGLGNIWKFPYLIGANGGGAFLIVYLFCIIFACMPVMVCELFIGRKTRSNAVQAFEKLKVKPFWKSIGFMGIIAAFLIMSFYSCVAGWVYLYIFKAIKGDFAGISAQSAAAQFSKASVGIISPILWQIIVIAVVSAVIIAGVQKGIERVTKTLMPILFILIIICDIRSLTLSGASQGLDFLFRIDFSKLTAQGILVALGLGFFKLSLGMGTMLTYGSYYTDDNNLIGTSAKVAVSDTIVSILAGVAIFPAVFTFGMGPDNGPGLLFMTIPLVFSKIPFGNVLLVAFFFLTAIAATTAMISMMEVPVAYLNESKKIPRKKAVLSVAVIIMLIGILASLSADGASLLGGAKVFGLTFFNLFDFVSSNILMPLGGFLILIVVGWFLSKKDFEYELSNKGSINTKTAADMLYLVIKYVTPVLLIIVFLNTLGIIRLS